MASMPVPEPPCGGLLCAELLDRMVDGARDAQVIGRATGVIMGRTDCSAAEAGDCLAEVADHRALTLRQAASAILTQHAAHLPAGRPPLGAGLVEASRAAQATARALHVEADERRAEAHALRTAPRAPT